MYAMYATLDHKQASEQVAKVVTVKQWGSIRFRAFMIDR